MTEYCANCDNEATQIVVHTGQEPDTPLCDYCATAYQWGQTDPRASLCWIDDYDNDDDDEDDGDSDEEEEYDERDHPEEYIEFVWDFSEEDE